MKKRRQRSPKLGKILRLVKLPCRCSRCRAYANKRRLMSEETFLAMFGSDPHSSREFLVERLGREANSQKRRRSYLRERFNWPNWGWARRQAVDFVRGVLPVDVEVESGVIWRGARAEGISKKALNEAKQDLGIKSIRVGRKWCWHRTVERIVPKRPRV